MLVSRSRFAQEGGGRLYNTLCHDGDGAIVWLDQIVWLPIMALCSEYFTIWKGLDFFASLPEGVLAFPFSGSIPWSAFLRHVYLLVPYDTSWTNFIVRGFIQGQLM